MTRASAPIPSPKMDSLPSKKAPRRKKDRVILHFDLDCFYAQCVENRQPSLKALPLGIKQKGILATCNYVARRRGVTKLMTIVEAKKICPDLVLADGEDLSPFRDVSKHIYALLRSYSWNGKVERLGLDEVFLDATDLVSYNVELLNRNALHRSYFCLSRSDPERGFEYDATSFAGCVHGDDEGPADDDGLRTRLVVASHLAQHLRLKIEQEGYTTACGISTNKLLAKLVGEKNKPRNQTTLLALREEDVWSFVDAHKLRKVPGIGFKTTQVLEGFVLGKRPDPNPHSLECSVTAGQVRTHPAVSPPALERLLSGPGSERGIGARVWALLHGVDDTEVKPARDVPTQISIEDTYKGLSEPQEIRRALLAVTTSLLRRMQVDLLEEDRQPHSGTTAAAPSQPRYRWLAQPRTIRLTTRPYASPSDDKPYNWARASRSCPLPGSVFQLGTISTEQRAERLVAETLLPLFYKLNPPAGTQQQQDVDVPGRWNVGLINVCVTNMAGADVGKNNRDIKDMLQRRRAEGQPEAMGSIGSPQSPDRTVRNSDDDQSMIRHEAEGAEEGDEGAAEGGEGDEQDRRGGSDADAWDAEDETADEGEADGDRCLLCGRVIPRFAALAHERYHSMEDA